MLLLDDQHFLSSWVNSVEKLCLLTEHQNLNCPVNIDAIKLGLEMQDAHQLYILGNFFPKNIQKPEIQISGLDNPPPSSHIQLLVASIDEVACEDLQWCDLESVFTNRFYLWVAARWFCEPGVFIWFVSAPKKYGDVLLKWYPVRWVVPAITMVKGGRLRFCHSPFWTE